MKLRNEAQRYWPRAAAVAGGNTSGRLFQADRQRQLAPAGALLITERELVVISEEGGIFGRSGSGSPFCGRNRRKVGGIVTFVPRVRLSRLSGVAIRKLGVLALQVHAAHGGEKLEISFPSDEEKAVSKAMKQMLPSRGSGDAAPKNSRQDLKAKIAFSYVALGADIESKLESVSTFG